MSESTDQRAPDPLGLDRADLRPVLEAMRRQAAEEIARLKRKLADREYAAERNIESATDRVALEQELGTLKHSLGEKEKTLDHITDECRRLEDQLEDRNVAFDGLKQEVQRKELSLKAAREEVQRLQRELACARDQSVDIQQPGSSGSAGLLPLPPVEPDPPSKSAHAATFSAGLVAGLAAVAVAVLVMSGGWSLKRPDWLPLRASDRDIAVEGPGERGPGPSEDPAAHPLGGGADSGSPDASRVAFAEPPPVADAVPAVLPTPGPQPLPPTERDRLRDGSLGPTLARLPGGLFQMGKNSLSGGDTGPEHAVRMPPFLIGTYEVTYQQYDGFVRAVGKRFPDDYGWGRGSRPVVGVSRADAEAYADWLTRQTGRRYRLPSEAEWEYAARAGSQTYYWWGFKPESGRANCFDCGSRWDNRSTAPVGSFEPSPFGLYDTAGNVMEWVSDCYAPGYENAPTDGSPRLDANCTGGVARGGAFNRPALSMRVWTRTRLGPDTRANFLGFRVARDP